jgi:hypothetical protein
MPHSKSTKRSQITAAKRNRQNEPTASPQCDNQKRRKRSQRVPAIRIIENEATARDQSPKMEERSQMKEQTQVNLRQSIAHRDLHPAPRLLKSLDL